MNLKIFGLDIISLTEKNRSLEKDCHKVQKYIERSVTGEQNSLLFIRIRDRMEHRLKTRGDCNGISKQTIISNCSARSRSIGNEKIDTFHYIK